MTPPPHPLQLPIFPLRHVVLFPHGVLPLHIFEPRYRQMFEDVLASGGPLGIACLKEGAPMEREGRPAVHDTFGVGQVLQHERTADGRYYLVLRGIWRARRLRELDTDKLYRVVEAGRLCDQVEDHAQVYALVETLRGCLLCLQANHPKLVGVLTRLFQEDEGPGPIADRLACVLFTDPVERQALLETRRVEARLQAIIDRLSELIARGCVPGSDALH